MKRNLLFLLVALLPLVASADEAQDLTLSDVQKSDCVRGSRLRANSNETKRTIVLTKEGTILTVQILGFVSNCATAGFDITPSMSGGSDGEPVSVSLGVKPIEPDVSAICECPFNVSFTLHGLEANSFNFSCWWYDGQVNLTEGEPLTLESITEPVWIYDWYCIIDKVNHTATLIDRKGSSEDLIIPWVLSYEGQEYYVTGIGEWPCRNDQVMTSVTLPPNLTSIADYGFYNCSNLQDVYCFADNVPTTGSNVFKGTPIATATLHVPAGLIDKYKATAPWNEFGNIVGEGNVTIDGLNYYLNSSFYRAPLIKGNNWEGELDIPSEVSFYGQTYTVTCIAQAAFFDNSKLTKVRIPKSIEYIIRGYYTTNPYEDVPTGLVSPDHMNPFMGCTALESIEVEEGNPGLKSVDGVLFSQDGKGYFPYLTNSYYGTGLCCYPAGARRESYTIPDGVEWISSEAFGDNQYISTLTIPGSMKQIYYNVFTGCSNLKNVYCYAEDVPIAYSVAFKGFPIESATLHVPAGSIDKYKTTSPWNEFGNIVALTTVPMKDIMNYSTYFTITQEHQYVTLYVEPRWQSVIKNEKEYTMFSGNFEDINYVDTLMLLRQDETKCFSYDIKTGTEHLLFDFGLQKGDMYNDDFNNIEYEVTDVRDSIIGNEKLHLIELNSQEGQRDIWLEGIGSIYTGILRACENHKDAYLLMCACPEWSTEWEEGCLHLFFPNNQFIRTADMTIKELYWDKPLETEEDWEAYQEWSNAPTNLNAEFLNDTLHVWGRVRTTCNLCPYMSCELKENNVSVTLYPCPGPEPDRIIAYDVDGRIPGFKRGTYLVKLWDKTLELKCMDSMNEPVTYTADQIATIVLPTVPDASKGKYYRLDRCEDGQIIFEQELHPQAHIPYIIVPNEDFSIDTSTLDLAGLSNDTVSIEGISFIGSYSSETLNEPEGFYFDIIDTTPDCGFSTTGETGKKAYIGALRAYLQVSWDEPYNHGGSKGPMDKMEIVLKDNPNAIGQVANDKLSNGKCFDLSGRQLSRKPAHGIYIKDGKKIIR